VGGGKGSVKEGEYGRNIMYENGKIGPVERIQEGGKRDEGE
jgi:hypothetical protein